MTASNGNNEEFRNNRELDGALDLRRLALAICVVVGVVVGLEFILLCLVLFSAWRDWPTLGHFGDLLAGVNSLFTALAFAGLIYTIFLQYRALQTQSEELEETQEAQNKQAKLSTIANLGDIYMRQRDIMERGDFRKRLWKAQKARDAGKADDLDEYERTSFEAWKRARDESERLLKVLDDMLTDESGDRRSPLQ